MKSRQSSLPRQWLIVDDRLGEALWGALRKLPPGSGVLVLYRGMRKGARARLIAKLRRIAAGRGLVLLDEQAGEAARVHDARELRQAALGGARLLLLSPIFKTRSHRSWRPLPRMRAAALLRLARAPVIALGGMDSRRFARVGPLGFQGWAGIDAFRT